jgi:hypothetical protein
MVAETFFLISVSATLKKANPAPEGARKAVITRRLYQFIIKRMFRH